MSANNFRETLERFGVPNAVAGLSILFIVAVPIVVIFASSEGRTATESVQITYQLALVLAGFIGLPLAVWRSWTAHRQAAIGLEQLKGLQRQIALAEAGADADRLQKGAEMLQAEGGAVRIAGVAILREIALNANHRYTSEAFSVLTAFARAVSEDEDERAVTRKSPEYLVEAFFAILACKGVHKAQIGKIILNEVVINRVKLEDSWYSQCTFQGCNINHSTIDDDSSIDFINCSFFDCVLKFHEFTFSKFDRCTFSSSTFSGDLDASCMNECKYYGLNKDDDLVIIGDNENIARSFNINRLAPIKGM